MDVDAAEDADVDVDAENAENKTCAGDGPTQMLLLAVVSLFTFFFADCAPIGDGVSSFCSGPCPGISSLSAFPLLLLLLVVTCSESTSIFAPSFIYRHYDTTMSCLK